MALISDPLLLAFVLVSIVAAALAAIFEEGGLTRAGWLLMSCALCLQLATTLWIWAPLPGHLIVGAAVFAAASIFARPKGVAGCFTFSSTFLITAMALPIAHFVADFWLAALAILASIGLAISMGPNRMGQGYAVTGAAFWLFTTFGVTL